MSIYEENVKPWQLIKYSPRVALNVYSLFISGKKATKPFGIKFEVSSICNLRCIMCPLSKGLNRKQGILKFEKFKEIYDQINPPYLNLTGIGEPLLNPDLFKIITYAKKKGSIVKLDTNANLLDKEKTEKLLDSNPNIVSISIDGVNKKSYEKIRRRGDFDVVIFNLKNLIKRRNERKSKTKIHVNFVLQKSNLNELPTFLKFIDSLGVDSINGDIALPLGKNKNEENRKIDKNLIKKILEEIKSIKTKASVNIEHILEFFECGGEIKNKKEANCFYPWYYPSITWDGYVVPCCYICDNEIVFGNVFENSFSKIWNNEKYQKFREMIASEKKGICKSCFIDETYIAKNIKRIKKIPLIGVLSKRKFN